MVISFILQNAELKRKAELSEQKEQVDLKFDKDLSFSIQSESCHKAVADQKLNSELVFLEKIEEMIS